MSEAATRPVDRVDDPNPERGHRCIILKIGGVTPEQLARLHEHLASDAAAISGPIDQHEDIDAGHGIVRRVARRNAVLLSARLEKGTRDRYAVEIRVLAEAHYSSDTSTAYRRRFRPSLHVLQFLFTALDLFPTEPRDEQIPA